MRGIARVVVAVSTLAAQMPMPASAQAPRSDPALAPPTGILTPPVTPPSPPAAPPTGAATPTPRVPPPPAAPGASGHGAGATIPSFQDLARPPSDTTLPELWGAIAYTASGRFWRTARQASGEAAEQAVRGPCERARAGACKVATFPRRRCAGLAAWQGTHSGRIFHVAVTRGGDTTAEATASALKDCRTQPNVRSACRVVTVLCGDGR